MSVSVTDRMHGGRWEKCQFQHVNARSYREENGYRRFYREASLARKVFSSNLRPSFTEL